MRRAGFMLLLVVMSIAGSPELTPVGSTRAQSASAVVPAASRVVSVAAPRADSLPSYIREYALPEAARGPLGIASGNSGQIWITAGKPRSLGVLDAATGAYRAYPSPPGASLHQIAVGPDGAVWVTDYEWSPQPVAEGLWRFTPEQGFRPVTLPGRPWGPMLIGLDKSGAGWVSGFLSGRLLRVEGDHVREFVITEAQGDVARPPGQVPGLAGVAIDGQDHVWVAISGRDQVARLNPATGQVATFPLPDPFYAPTGLALGAPITPATTAAPATPAGRATAAGVPAPLPWLFVGSHAGSSLAALDTATGRVVARYETLPPPPAANSDVTRPTGLVAGADGDIWFAEHDGGRIGRIIPATATVVEHKLPGTAPAPQWVAVDPSGHLWYAAEAAGTVGRINRGAPYAAVELAAPAPFIPAGATFQGFLRVTGVGEGRHLRMVAGRPAAGAAVRVQFEPAEFDLAPGEQRMVRFTLTVPAGSRTAEYGLPMGVDAGDYMASTRVPYTVVRSRAWWPYVMWTLGPLGVLLFTLVYRRSRKPPA